MENEVARYERKMKSCQSMTDLLVAMSSWNSFRDRYRAELTEEQKNRVDQAYLDAEAKLITLVKPSLW